MNRHILSLALLCLASTGVSAKAATASLHATVSPVGSPAGPGAMGSSLVSGAGAHWLSWIEPVGEEKYALKCARFDAVTGTWSAASTIAEGDNWFVNWADFPVLTVQADRLTAAWLVYNPGRGAGHHGGKGYHSEFSVSKDGGKSWSAPAPLTTESSVVEFVAFQPMPDGRLLAAWLDGRARAKGNKQQTLYSRFVGEAGPDMLVDSKVCDCCQLSFIPSPDGGAVLSYRGRTDEEVRDMRVAKFKAGVWEAAKPLHADNWLIPACPVNGPQLATAAGASSAVWFSAGQGNPRVQVARAIAGSADFVSPTRIDLGSPLGRVDNVLLADGTALFTWLEASGGKKEGGIYLRAQSADGALSEPVMLASTTTSRASGFPRITLLADAKPSRLLISYTRDEDVSQVSTAIVTVH